MGFEKYYNPKTGASGVATSEKAEKMRNDVALKGLIFTPIPDPPPPPPVTLPKIYEKTAPPLVEGKGKKKRNTAQTITPGAVADEPENITQ